MGRILLIEDHPHDRERIKQILEEEGHQVLEANNGREGERLLANTAVQLVVTDLFMPVQDGITTLLRLHKLYPSLPLVVVSGGGKLLQGQTYLEHAKFFGAAACLRKPIQAPELASSIRKILTP